MRGIAFGASRADAALCVHRGEALRGQWRGPLVSAAPWLPSPARDAAAAQGEPQDRIKAVELAGRP